MYYVNNNSVYNMRINLHNNEIGKYVNKYWHTCKFVLKVKKYFN